MPIAAVRRAGFRGRDCRPSRSSSSSKAGGLGRNVSQVTAGAADDGRYTSEEVSYTRRAGKGSDLLRNLLRLARPLGPGANLPPYAPPLPRHPPHRPQRRPRPAGGDRRGGRGDGADRAVRRRAGDRAGQPRGGRRRGGGGAVGARRADVGPSAGRAPHGQAAGGGGRRRRPRRLPRPLPAHQLALRRRHRPARPDRGLQRRGSLGTGAARRRERVDPAPARRLPPARRGAPPRQHAGRHRGGGAGARSRLRPSDRRPGRPAGGDPGP